MGIAKSYSAQLIGLSAEIITIEVDISNGLHAFSVVGLGDRSVEESKDRVAAAIKNTGYTSPKQKNQKVIVSLAPADIRKEGPSFDLGIALTYLSAAGEILFDSQARLFFGELSLEGNVRRVSGLLPLLCQARERGYGEAFVPEANAEEASLAQGIKIYPISSLQQVINHLSGTKAIEPLRPDLVIPEQSPQGAMDMKTVRGNETAKRGLEIAASGAHNVMMSGPPGTGKTMLAQCFSSILPALSYGQSVEVTGIHSAAKVLGPRLISHPPFRAPHHTASYPAIVGGGSFPKPGEITLAHRGVLFLDEFPEFDRSVIEALRQPLEDRVITISRARGVITFPAQCILIVSMNPCPCGKAGSPDCTCTAAALQSYRRKISGPIMDRLDIALNVSKVDYSKLSKATGDCETSSIIKSRVTAARSIQLSRFAKHDLPKLFNSEMNAEDIEKMIVMSEESRTTLARISEKFQLSGRAFHRIIKVARTIADLAGAEVIQKEHILEAFQYRQKI